MAISNIKPNTAKPLTPAGNTLFDKAYMELYGRAASASFDSAHPDTQFYNAFLTNSQFMSTFLQNGGITSDELSNEIVKAHVSKSDLPAKASAHKPYQDAVKRVFNAIKEGNEGKLTTALVNPVGTDEEKPAVTAEAMMAPTAPMSPELAASAAEIEAYLSGEPSSAPQQSENKSSVEPPVNTEPFDWGNFIGRAAPPVDTAKIESAYRIAQSSHGVRGVVQPDLKTTQTPPDLAPPKFAIVLSAPLSQIFKDTASNLPTVPKIDAKVTMPNAPDAPMLTGADHASKANTAPPPPPAPPVAVETDLIPDELPVVMAAEKSEKAVDVKNYKDYTVAKGDSLWKIVKSQYPDIKTDADITRAYKNIAIANNIKNPDLIDIGQKLKLPNDVLAKSDFNKMFINASEGLVAANTPEAPSIRPQSRPEAFGLTG